MADYRMYFLDGKDGIQAKDDFRAESDIAAMFIADWVFDACSEHYVAYELWIGTRRIVPQEDGHEEPVKLGLSRNDVSRGIQQVVADRERVLLDSAWAVAR